MKIHFHNCFEITCGRQKAVFYNTVLGGINGRFLNGENYTKYIVFGTGAHGGIEGVTSLAAFAGGKMAELYGKNFDISKGAVYLKKHIELGAEEFNGITIKEAALSPQQDGGNIVNYALVPNGGVLKKAGENLTITITLYLEITRQNIIVCGGENPLMELFFGLKNSAACDFKVALSDCGSLKTVMRSDFAIYGFVPAKASVYDGKLVVSAELPQNTDYPELLLLDGTAPCLRLPAGGDICAVSENVSAVTLNGTALMAGECETEAISVTGLNGSLPFTAESVCVRVTDIIKNPFEFILKPDGKVFYGTYGRYLAVYGKDTFSVYRAEGQKLEKLEFEYMDVSVFSVINALIDSGGNLFLQTDSYPYMSFYRNDNGILRVCSPQRQPESGIVSVSLAEYGGERHIYYITYVNGQKAYSDYRAEFTETSYNETLIKTYQAGDFAHYHGRENNTEIFYDLYSGAFTVYPAELALSKAVKEVIKSCGEAAINGSYILLRSGSKWRMFNIGSGAETQLYSGGVKKVFAGADGKLLVKLYTNNKLSGAHIDGKSGRLTRFEINRRISGAITDVRIFGQEGIIISAKTGNTDNYYLPSGKNTLVYVDSLKDNDSQVSIQTQRKSFSYAGGKQVKFRFNL